MDGCSNELFEQAVQRLVKKQAMSSDLFQRFAALWARDFNARSESFDLLIPYTDEDIDFVFALCEMRFCPQCKLLIQHSEGCNILFVSLRHALQQCKRSAASWVQLCQVVLDSAACVKPQGVARRGSKVQWGHSSLQEG